MDSNYEAQNHFTRQRLDARREQAASERLLREGRPLRMGRLKQFLMSLFRRIGQRQEQKREQQPAPVRLAISGKSKG